MQKEADLKRENKGLRPLYLVIFHMFSVKKVIEINDKIIVFYYFQKIEERGIKMKIEGEVKRRYEVAKTYGHL